ncbi:MAG: hypothetical protein EHM64_11025 [Ignavibacteriae bacterium]|nr:MAG: hypothetical protein EHM64_11025 [Ignavibacteriota bacterium]
MTSVEQRKMVQRLKQAAGKMSREERAAYEMMAKRDHDDEELDSLTMTKLKQLHAKYFPKHSKDDLEDAWSKLTKGK